MDDLANITLQYWITVLRIRRMAVPEADKLVILADVDVIYRRERARLLDDPQPPAGRPAGTSGQGGT